jgi:MFS superfamily sulfate permease-like transporter
MNHKSIGGLFSTLRNDIPASIVVFFVAVPLCLGIALASGAPLFAGIIAGIAGGIVVGMASGSAVGVSGPAAGLAVIVLSSIESLGGWQIFLVAVVLAGIIQIILGYLKLGTIAYYFPSSVIKGMLTGIGLLIILKQIPHALGYDSNYVGDLAFKQPDQENTFSALGNMLQYISPAVFTITLISLFILLLWENVLVKKSKIFGIINGPLVAVVAGILLNYAYQQGIFSWSLRETQVVQLPVSETIGDFFRQFTLPDFSQLTNPQVYLVAFVIAVIASLETLLCVEATDKIDPEKRITPTNRELKAQGLGNIVSGLIGGLPVTQVIVRSSANITFGGRSKMSTIIHGFLLLISAIAIPKILNLIPLATLAAILLVVGYKLAKPEIFREVYLQGREQFIPFVVTVSAILVTDLLKGIMVGMAFAVFFILRNNFKNPYYIWKNGHQEGEEYIITLSEEVSFLNKGSILQMLNHVPANSKVVIDATRSKSIHYDIIEVIRNYLVHARSIGVTAEVKGLNLNDCYHQKISI